MNIGSRIDKLESAIAQLPDAGRLCLCPLPGPTKAWDTGEGVEELIHAFTRPCPKCGLTRWSESMLANFEKAYGGDVAG